MTLELPLVARRVRLLMRRKRYAQYQLAMRAGVAEGTIRYLLQGHDIRLSTLESIAKALDVPVIDLLIDPPKPN